MLKGGTYRLFWHLENTLTHEFTTPTKPNVGDSEGYISIGEIWMGSLGIPREAAGVSWSGDLDLLQSILKKLNMTKNRIIALARLVIVILIFSTALAVML